MNKRKWKDIFDLICDVLIMIGFFILLFLYLAEVPSTCTASAAESFDSPAVIRCTCYCDYGTTANGQQTRPNTAAGKSEWLGYVAALYEVNPDGSMGDFIGYYEFTDTGAGIDTDSDGVGDTIKNGESIDVWQPTLQDCYDWVGSHGDYVYMKIIRGVG